MRLYDPQPTRWGNHYHAPRSACARDDTDNAINVPYTMNYTHDAFGHITQFSGAYYNTPHTSNYSYDNTNRNPYWSYDAEGNITIDDEASYTVDAADVWSGRRSSIPTAGFRWLLTRDWFDGNGRLAKRVKNFGSTDPAPQTNYYLRSSGDGSGPVGDRSDGRKLKTVPADGTTLAEQELVTIGSTTTEKLTFIHRGPGRWRASADRQCRQPCKS
ncbi:MAG: hypothetical protein IPK58_24765 [Acidobacteria bacterium]|nr:hypothetical protein [Acidobacteriota bacterium]